jgi:hypothetical protein
MNGKTLVKFQKYIQQATMVQLQMLVKQKFMLSVDTHQPIYFNPNVLAIIKFSSDVEASGAAASSEQGSDGNLVITCHANLNTQ